MDELRELILRARHESLPVTLRGSGRSYGDAALNRGGLVIDTTRLNRMLAWDPIEGIAEVEPGMTIEGLWRRTIQDGFWPPVVPGSMFPTLAGCLSMNVHGKNNFRAGTLGEHVLDFDLLTGDGNVLCCSRDRNPDIFRAAIGGAGLLGAITRLRIRMKPVETGLLRVRPLLGRSFSEMFDVFEAQLPRSDYLVGWIDCFAAGESLGRGVIHRANYVHAEEVADPEGSLHIERQTLPSSVLGVPKSWAWLFMRPMMNDVSGRLTNALKFGLSRLEPPSKSYLQSHVGFAFLLDYLPNWRLAYGPHGFVQHQVFVPAGAARELLPKVLRMCQARGHVSYLGVLKRHRPDEFLLSHGLDGYSLALDFPVRPRGHRELWALLRDIADLTLDAGGRFYFAKDAVLTASHCQRAFGPRLDTFRQLKSKLDPDGLFASDLSRRLIDAE